MKKILFISPMRLPIPAVKGGAVETIIDNIIFMNEIEKRFDLTVISVFDLSLSSQKSKNTYTKFLYYKPNKVIFLFDKIINYLIKDFNILNKLFILKYIKKILLKNNFDFVIVENQGFLTYLYLNKNIKNKYKGKLIYHLHNDISIKCVKSFIENERKMLISNYLKKNILKYYNCNDNSFLLLKNGIDTSNLNILNQKDRKKLRGCLNYKDDDIVLCFVGRIVKEKGIFELIQSMQFLPSNVKLLIVGSVEFGKNATSSFASSVLEMANNDDRIQLTGYINNKELWKYYQLSDLAVLPSIWQEPAGLTMLEALFNGLYVITTNSGGIPEYLDKKYCCLLNIDDNLPESISSSVLTAIKSGNYGKFDINKRNYIINNFSTKIYYDKFTEIILGDGNAK